MKSVLITGATGFIGQYLVEALRQKTNYRVIAATRRQVDLPVEIRHVGDLDAHTDWHYALRDIDVVVHLAARAHVLNEQGGDADAEFERVNTAGTKNLVKQAIAAGVQHCIFLSSIGAVASFSEVPLTEEHDCLPDTAYGRSKLATEQALVNLSKDSTLSWTILRPTLVYGAGNPGNMERLVKLVKLGLPLPLGAIRNQRSFVYVENLVDAIARCILNSNAYGQVFHISDDQTVSTPDLIRLIAQNTHQPCFLLPVSMGFLRAAGQVSDGLESLVSRQLPFNSQTLQKLMGSLVVDNRKFCNTLSWNPPFTFEVGLHKTFQQP